MMGGGGLLKGPRPAYLKFSGEMLEAFMILTDSMSKKGSQNLLSHGKFSQTYSEAADELRRTPSFDASEFNTTLANKLHSDLSDTVKPNTPIDIAPSMKEMVNVCSNYLAQYAEFNKDKGPAFTLLIKMMRSKQNEQLYKKEKAQRTLGTAAAELEAAKGLESDHDDPNLSQEIYSTLSRLVENVTPDDLKTDMKETMDICSKYLSQCAIDAIERGPAFDLLIKELEKHGSEQFTNQFPVLAKKFIAAYSLKSAPGFTSTTPDVATTPIFVGALHKSADAATPKALHKDMQDVIERCAAYLSAFARDRDKALQVLLKMMKDNPSKELAKRNNYAMNYAVGANELETASNLVPFLPVKDIADEEKANLTKDVENLTPSELKIAMKSLVQDAGRYLSQSMALKSGAAGERYPLNLLAAVKDSLGDRPLFKYKAYGQTYSDAAETLKYAGPLESDPKCEDLKIQIETEMKRGVPAQVSPNIAAGLNDTMNDASKHLAKIGAEKGRALDYLVGLMKERGESPLGQMQGYLQTYSDGAKRIENAPSLTNEKVDKGTYESVRGKLTQLVTEKPSEEHKKHITGLVDDSSKFLAAPLPETESEKRRVLADLMARKGDQMLAQDGLYKITYTEGGEEIMKAPVGVTASDDESMKVAMHSKVTSVIPDKKMQDLLKDPANEGAAHLANILKGRGEAMKVIHDEMKIEKDKEFLAVGSFKKSHEQAADMLSSATHFGGQHPSPVLLDMVNDRIEKLPKSSASDMAKKHMKDTSDIVASYIAGRATDECGLDAKALAAIDSKGSRSTEEFKKKTQSTAQVNDAAATSDRNSSNLNKTPSRYDANVSSRIGSETDEEKRKREEIEAKKRAEQSTDLDRERQQALSILHTQLKAQGANTFYKQPQTELTHQQASAWIDMKPPMKVDKTVKESADTARLHKKFERKLSVLVSKVTPPNMNDAMQDVVIESARILSEYFVSSNYKALVREALISEMQKRGNEILIKMDSAAETFFFAAQRLKKAKTMTIQEPRNKVSYYLTKKLEEIIRCRSMARKLTSTMKEHIKDASDYLSESVTTPDEYIAAYVALLCEMETAGEALLVEGNIPKSYKDASAYLRKLTTFEDQIQRPNPSLHSSIENKLKVIMANVVSRTYTTTVLHGVISESASLLVSYIMLQGEKTEALKILIDHMDRIGNGVLLCHGNIRKTYTDGADKLRGKNTDQLAVQSADPVVSRKIQIKLNNLMIDNVPEKYKTLIDDVIEDATLFLAVHLLQPQIIQVCKCMKNVFVQCELWCDEILRRVAQPCCTCSRYVSLQALEDVVPAERLRAEPGSSKVQAPGIEISITDCPSKQTRVQKHAAQPCPAPKPTEGCRQQTNAYHLYSAMVQHNRFNPSKLRPRFQDPITSDAVTDIPSSPPRISRSFSPTPFSPASSPRVRLLHKREQNSDKSLVEHANTSESSSPDSFYTPPSTNVSKTSDERTAASNAPLKSDDVKINQIKTFSAPFSTTSRNIGNTNAEDNSRAPIISTDQMTDWHAMMVSLMWNVQAWRDWIQEIIDRALSYSPKSADADENWTTLQRRIESESLQWRQYNAFSRRLTLRLALRYRDKTIVSPTRATVKTEAYLGYQREMLEIIDMFNRWTQWLTLLVKETHNLKEIPGSSVPLHEIRWSYLREKIRKHSEDWTKYNLHLKECWQHKYKSLIADWLPPWNGSGPVWVMSACGAVPSGAVSAGVAGGELIWVARTTHKNKVLPAALHPSKHCCIVYADGGAHCYTKYQVMCGAAVQWVSWRGGEECGRAVRAGGGEAGGVLVGRVQHRGDHLLGPVLAPHYRCHLLIYGRPFAFNCYELLVLADDVST
ncbi:uncharacterized protein LOC101739332 isoform X3 [Bombyx mori]